MFQTARELFQQRMDEEEEAGWRKPKPRPGQMYHVNANGEFSDSGGEEEEESIADQIRRRIGLASRVAVEKEKPGAKGARSASRSVQSAQKSVQSAQKSVQSTLNFGQHASKSREVQSSLPPNASAPSASSVQPSKKQEKPLLHPSSNPNSNSNFNSISNSISKFNSNSNSISNSVQSKPKIKLSPEKKKSFPLSASSHTHSSLSEPSSSSHPSSSSSSSSSSSAPSKKRPSPAPSALEPSSKVTLDFSKAPDRSLSLSSSPLTLSPKRLLHAITEDVQNLSACLDVSAKQRVKCVEASSLPSSSTLACRRSTTSRSRPISRPTGSTASPGSRRGCRSTSSSRRTGRTSARRPTFGPFLESREGRTKRRNRGNC